MTDPKGSTPTGNEADDSAIEAAHEVIDAVIAATQIVIDYADQVIADSTAGDLDDGDVD